VRLASIQRKNPSAVLADSVDDVDLSILDEPKVHDIIMHLAQYPTAVRNAYQLSEPSQLVTWCFRLSHMIGSAWETVRIMNATAEEQKARLFMYVQAREVLASAMKLLSLTPIERM
jgi:arginyl-tRNA synthetase